MLTVEQVAKLVAGDKLEHVSRTTTKGTPKTCRVVDVADINSSGVFRLRVISAGVYYWLSNVSASDWRLPTC